MIESLYSAFAVIRNPGPLVLTFANWVLCAAVFWACLCRMRMTSRDTLVIVRVVHTIVITMALVSGFRGPLFGEQVSSWWAVTQMGCIFLLLVMNMGAWKHRPPMIVQKNSTQPAAFDGHDI